MTPSPPPRTPRPWLNHKATFTNCVLLSEDNPVNPRTPNLILGNSTNRKTNYSPVRWHNLIKRGGMDDDEEALNKFSTSYNVKTQKSHMVPLMLYKRIGCMAVVVDSMIIVMGGLESFNFSRYMWEELPSMHETRAYATSITC